jgi:hypothetical protein
MEMTTDKSKRILVDRYIDTYVVCGGSNYNPTINITREDYEAFKVAINIMRKYQKIQEILRWNNAPSPYYKPDGELFREICEVIEDGKID